MFGRRALRAAPVLQFGVVGAQSGLARTPSQRGRFPLTLTTLLYQAMGR